VAGYIVKGVVCFLSAGLLVVWSSNRILNCRVPADSSRLDNQRVGITYRVHSKFKNGSSKTLQCVETQLFFLPQSIAQITSSP
jgi:hypothetical protein